MWVKILPYLAVLAAVIALIIGVNNHGYNNGKAAAEKTCADTTVPKAKAEVQAVCDANSKATKEENDALYANLNTLRDTYDRLRASKPIVAKCLPLTSTCNRDVGANGAPQPAAGVGVYTEWLDRTFYEAATDIARGQSCQRQLARIYELNAPAK